MNREVPEDDVGIDVLLTDPALGGALDANMLDGEMIDGDGLLIALDGSEAGVVEVAEVLEHTANLAMHLPDDELNDIAQKVMNWVEQDEQSRAEWQEGLKDAMRILGISPIAADDAPFDGASTVTHPLVMEAAVQYQSRAIEELFPSAGPVKCRTIPNPTEDILAQADRVESFLNYYFTEEDEGYYDDTDKMLMLKALHGHVFRKVFRCPLTGKVKGRHVTAADMLVPYESSSLDDADHYTHKYNMPLNDIRRAQQNGHFRDVEFKEGDFGTVDMDNERKTQDESDRRQNTEYSEVPTLLECHCNLILEGVDDTDEIGGGKIALPYIVTVEKNTEKVLSIYRNWNPDDERRLKRVWFASYKYLQGLGFYGIGLFHVLGNLAATAGSSLRALLDAAARSNLQGGFVAKMGGGRKLDLEIEHGVYREIDLTAEELNKAFFNVPFKEPSQNLVLILREMVETARRFSSTTEAMVGEGSSTGPVGTTLALIEQGSKVFSAIHKRMHKSYASELRCFVRLMKETGAEYPYPVGPYLLVEDLDDRVDVMPVSDPTITSNTQRIAMAQAAQQIVRGDPELYGPENRHAVDLALMKVMKVPNAEQLLKKSEPEPPPELDPVTENAAVLTGKPIKAYPEQDHDAHIQTHLNFAQALPPEGQKAIEGPLLAHIAEHAALKYQKLMAQAIQQAMQQGIQIPPDQLSSMIPVPQLVPQMNPQQGVPGEQP